MAHSRLEKIGTIYTRARGLLQTQAMRWEDRPLWYDIYEKFPPKEEPLFARPAPNIPLKNIFYKEDRVRAAFHKRNKNVGTVNLLNTRGKSLTQRFIKCHETIDEKYKGSDVPQEQVYSEALDLLKQEATNRGDAHIEAMSLTSAFKEASEKTSTKEANKIINVKDIFKE